MAGHCWLPYKPSQPLNGCSLFQRLIPCSASGNKTTCLQIQEGLGFLRKIGFQQRNSSLLLTIWMLQPARSAQPTGLAIKSISAQTCDEDLPRLITQVMTTIAPIPDRHALPEAHAVLERRDLLAIRSISLMRATSMLRRWLRARQTIRSIWWVQLLKIIEGRAREQNGYALADFSLDWEHEHARCPQGQTSSSWTPTWTRNQEIIKIKFGFAICGACPVRSQCTRVQATKPVREATSSALCLRGCSSARTDGRVQAGVCKVGRHRRGPCGSACGAWAYGDLVPLESLEPTFSMSSPQLP